jgi:hypothetical protein
MIKNALAGIGIALVLCIALAVVAAIVAPEQPEQLETAQQAAPTTEPQQPTEPPAVPAEQPAEAPTIPPQPTAAPEPTVVPEPTAPPAGPAAVGEPVQIGPLVVTVESVERRQQLGEYVVAGEGETYVVALVAIQNTGDETHTFNVFNIGARSGDGFDYNPAFGATQPLTSGDLQSGETARGYVGFKVPEGTQGLVFSYDPNMFISDDEARIRLE